LGCRIVTKRVYQISGVCQTLNYAVAHFVIHIDAIQIHDQCPRMGQEQYHTTIGFVGFDNPFQKYL